MELQDIVPSLELCKQLKHPHFYESCFLWCYCKQPWQDRKKWNVIKSTAMDARPYKDVFPAPTLEEVYAGLNDLYTKARTLGLQPIVQPLYYRAEDALKRYLALQSTIEQKEKPKCESTSADR